MNKDEYIQYLETKLDFLEFMRDFDPSKYP